MHRHPDGVTRRGRPVRSLALAGGLALLLLTPGVAAADAELLSSVPADGEVLTEAPTEVVLTFNEAITDQSSFAVLNASGATVATGSLDPANTMTMRGTLPNLAPGTYEVRWVARSADGHLPRGTFTFTVATPTPAPTDEPSPSTAASPTSVPTAAPTPSPAPSAAGGGSGIGIGTDVLLPIAVVGLLIGGGLAFFLRRRGAA
jgi:methionine-rich copper-binding protein CopC